MGWFKKLAEFFGEPKEYDYVVLFRFHSREEFEAFRAAVAPLYEVTDP